MGKHAERLCLFNLLNQNPSAPDKSAHNVIISFLWEIPAGIGTNDQERNANETSGEGVLGSNPSSEIM